MAKNTIKIKSYTDIQEEYNASEAITPGMLVELASATTVKKHVTAGGNIQVMVAVEDELQGNGITTDYSSANPVQCWIPRAGDKGYMLLKDGETVAVGGFVESAGGGLVQAHDSDSAAPVISNQIVGVALEALDLSASANTANGRLIVRFV